MMIMMELDILSYESRFLPAPINFVDRKRYP